MLMLGERQNSIEEHGLRAAMTRCLDYGREFFIARLPHADGTCAGRSRIAHSMISASYSRTIRFTS